MRFNRLIPSYSNPYMCVHSVCDCFSMDRFHCHNVPRAMANWPIQHVHSLSFTFTFTFLRSFLPSFSRCSFCTPTTTYIHLLQSSPAQSLAQSCSFTLDHGPFSISPLGPLLTLWSLPSFLPSFFPSYSLSLSLSQSSLIEHPLLFTNRHPSYSTPPLPLFDIPSPQKCGSIITLLPPLTP